jgi:hypothetical protein
MAQHEDYFYDEVFSQVRSATNLASLARGKNFSSLIFPRLPAKYGDANHVDNVPALVKYPSLPLQNLKNLPESNKCQLSVICLDETTYESYSSL